MADVLDKQTKDLLYTKKTRCNLCHEIPIIKELTPSGGLSYFISAECLNKHGVCFCTLEDFCKDSNQLEKLKCNFCNKPQGIIQSKSELYQYCKECKFMCPTCVASKHKKLKKKHPLMEIQNLDFICFDHQKNYIGFCEQCNINICQLCEPTHKNHNNKHYFKNEMPNSQKIQEVKEKVDKQKKSIDEINKVLNEIIKNAQEYLSNLNQDLKLNIQILNCLDTQHLNYQCLKNFDKILDIDYSDISWVDNVNKKLDEFIKIIKDNKSDTKNTPETTTQTSSILDKELMDKFQKSVIGDKKKVEIDELENQNKNKYDGFSECELLKEIAEKNKNLYKNDDIFGDLKDIYIMPKCKAYLMLIDNGIFLYDQITNDLLCYIDINDNLELDEVKSVLYSYDNKLNIIYLYVGTENKIKIYKIEENDEYKYNLISKLKVDKFKNFCLNDNLDLFVLLESGYKIFKFKKNKYELDIEHINIENEKTMLFSIKNYGLIYKQEKEEISFIDKNKNFESSFVINNIKANEQSKIIELNEKLISLSNENILQIIDIEKKNINYIHKFDAMKNIMSFDLINNKQLLLSGNSDDKYFVLFSEFNESYSKISDKKKLENLRCDIIRTISSGLIILFTNYGVNILEI